jgi:peptidoglycan hydrolase-like protein with peptidoglycan-binding domain
MAYLVPSLVALRNEVNARFPKRDKSSDGWIGDDSHATRFSSHNPTDSGAVRGLDLDIDDNDAGRSLARQVLDAVIGDHRVWYVIHKGVIWSRTYGWRARAYTGNPHTGHIHVSVQENLTAWRDTSRWLAPEKRVWQWNPDVVSNLALVQQEFQKAAGVRAGEPKRYHGVAAIQNALNVKAGANLPVDGYVGPKTLAAWKAYETKHGGTGRLTTPDEKSLGGDGLQIMYRFEVPAPPKPPAKVKVRVATHNVYVKRAIAEVNKTYSALLAKHRPHAVLLQETAQMYGKWAIPGYQVIQFAPKRIHEGHVIETSSNTVLVRNDVAVQFKALLDLGETWKGPKVGALHDPRAPITVTIEVEGKDVRLLDVHGPFGAEAVAEFNAAIVDWIETSPYPALAGGDYNQSFDKVVAKIGTPTGATVDGKAPDMVVTDDLKKTGSANLGKQGSDTHYFKIFDYEI